MKGLDLQFYLKEAWINELESITLIIRLFKDSVSWHFSFLIFTLFIFYYFLLYKGELHLSKVTRTLKALCTWLHFKESTELYKSQANAAFEQRLHEGKCLTTARCKEKFTSRWNGWVFLTVQTQRHGNRAAPLPKGGLCSSDDRDVSCCTTLAEFGFQIRRHLYGHTAARQGEGKKKKIKGIHRWPQFSRATS